MKLISISERFNYPTYTVRRKILKLLGAAFHIYSPSGEVVFYSNLKAFKLKEDIRVYTGEDMQTEVLSIKARRMLDFASTYDVFDPTTNEPVGALRRKGVKSLIQDEWTLMDAAGREIGYFKEDSTVLALVRRFVTNLIPQTFQGVVQGTQVCTFKQNFNPFVLKMTLDFSQDAARLLDRRLGIAAAVLLCAIEQRQQ